MSQQIVLIASIPLNRGQRNKSARIRVVAWRGSSMLSPKRGQRNSLHFNGFGVLVPRFQKVDAEEIEVKDQRHGGGAESPCPRLAGGVAAK